MTVFVPNRDACMKRTSAVRVFEGLVTAVRVLETKPPFFLRSVALRVLETEGVETLGPQMAVLYRRLLQSAQLTVAANPERP